MAEAGEHPAIQRLIEDVAELRRDLSRLRVEKEAIRAVLRATRFILSRRDPEFKLLSEKHIRELPDFLLSQGLDANDPLVQATIAEAESFLAEGARAPLRESLRVVQGGRDGAPEAGGAGSRGTGA